jgi:hypothetical protein
MCVVEINKMLLTSIAVGLVCKAERKEQIIYE